MQQQVVICYYVTGHGYGHATRVIELVKCMLSNPNQIYSIDVISSLSSEFFKQNLSEIGHSNNSHVHYHQRTLDIGAVQKGPLIVDAAETLHRYYHQIHLNHSRLLTDEITFLRDIHAQIVLSDVTSLCLPAAKAVGIPSVIVSNFTWDVIMASFMPLDEIVALGSDVIHKYEDMLEQCRQDYCTASHYLQLPGTMFTPKGYDGTLIKGPMICRKAILSREVIRERYQVPNNEKLIILGFGGHKGSNLVDLHDSMLPEHCKCLVLGASDEVFTGSKFIGVSPDEYIPDLIAASDVVLGKLGYGFVSECIYHNTPLIYVPRLNWPEEEYLESLLLHHRLGIRLSEEDFYNGSWSSYLIEAFTMSDNSPQNIAKDASIEMEEAILSILQQGGGR